MAGSIYHQSHTGNRDTSPGCEKEEPDAERPFRAWGFPATGVICAVGWTAVALFVSATNLDSTMYGLILTAISVPVYLFLKRHRQLGKTST